jgi:hypothetical protein
MRKRLIQSVVAPAVYDKVVARAKRENRTISGMVAKLLEEAVEHDERTII